MGILDFANCIAATIALSHAPWVGSAQSFQAARGRTHAAAKRAPDIEAGIYVRPSVTLNEMWKHFRKLTGLQYERGKWLYFRFWEVKSYTAPFDHRPSISAIPLTLITPDEGIELHALSSEGQYTKIGRENEFATPTIKKSSKVLSARHHLSRIQRTPNPHEIEYRKFISFT